jgi:hypothetical protein
MGNSKAAVAFDSRFLDGQTRRQIEFHIAGGILHRSRNLECVDRFGQFNEPNRPTQKFNAMPISAGSFVLLNPFGFGSGPIFLAGP